VDYIGNIVYKNDKIDYIQTAEGRFVYETNGSVHYEFYAKDHLGNVRATYSRSPIHPHNIHVTQLTDYYPFGLPHGKPNGTNKYLYNGKEIDNELHMYDYGARFLGLDIPVWRAVDPLAEKYYSLSPYAYCAGNPIRFNDVDGRYFDDKNEKKASRIEKRANRRAEKLERKADRIDNQGGNSGDLRDRAGELRQSATDIVIMRNEQNTEYRFSGLNSKSAKNNNIEGPTILRTGTNNNGDNVVTMFTENTMSSKLHESRHGGDLSRGTLQFNANGGYGVSDEVSAYRAQYSWNGQMSYREQPNQAVMLQRIMAGQDPTIAIITNINQITRNVINSIVDPGFHAIYPPSNIPINIWNNN